MTQHIEIYNPDTGDIHRTVVLDLESDHAAHTIDVIYEQLADEGAIGPYAYREKQRSPVITSLTPVEIKWNCERHIFDHFSQSAQRNLALAGMLGQLTDSQNASLAAAFAWINECRLHCQNYCNLSPSQNVDLTWPDPPEDLAGLVSEF